MAITDISPSVIFKGDLANHPLIELLGVIFACRMTGVLDIEHGKQKTRIFFGRGIPVNAETTSPGFSIVDLMSCDNRLSVEDELQVKQLALERNMDTATCLREILSLDETQVYYYQTEAVREITIKACGFSEGSYRFEEGDEILANTAMYDINPLQVIYEGMRRYHVTDLAAEVHAIEKVKIKLNQEVREHYLLPEPLYKHSDILDMFLQEMPVGRSILMLQKELGDINGAIHFLYLLLVTRFLVAKERKGKAAATTAPCREESALERSPSPRERSEEISTDYIIARPGRKNARREKIYEVQKEQEPEPQRAQEERTRQGPRPQTQAEPESNKIADAREKLEKIKKEMDGAMRLYDLFGLSFEDGIEELQEAYVVKSRGIAAHGLPEDAPDDLVELANDLQQRLDQALATLVEPAKRIEYELDMFEKEKEQAWNRSLKKNMARRMAERSRWYVRHNAPSQAREILERAINLDPEKPEYYMELGWAIFREQPAQADKAEQYLRSALKIEPSLDQAWYYLGLIAKRNECNQEAMQALLKALELNPNHKSARRELDYLEQHVKQRGLWSRIFGPSS